MQTIQWELVPNWFWGLWITVVGSVIGSFLNVCIYRLPRDESITFPPSHCPRCNARIAAYDNIPILSYLILWRKCRHCKEPISLQYPIIEAINAALYLLLFWQFGLTWELPVYALFTSAMLVVAVIDYYHQIIPNEISLGGLPFGLLAAIFILQIGWKESLLGMISGGGVLLAFGLFWLIIFKIEGMGMGDVKLMGMVGAFLGWKLALFTIMFGSLCGSIVGILLIGLKKENLKTKIPFGSFLAPSAVLALFSGNRIIDWYINLL
ncbi:MAG: hypothetical protein B6244_00325 [Candidatus Cloacimonetes bacterium 4572_55]|nr:MAG: hypothetical protein B6244_00325 [Candidatus Cloacimonetes bacterium 4572_55]